MPLKPLHDPGAIDCAAPPAAASAVDADAPPGTEPGPEAHGPMPVLVGCPRSGTTLLAVMLDSHPLLAMPPETAFLPELRRFDGRDDEALRREFFALVTTDRWGVSNWDDVGVDRDEYWRRLCALRSFSITSGLRILYGMYAERLGKPLFGEKTPADTHCMPEIEAWLPEARFVHIVRDPRDVVLSLRRTSAGRGIRRTARIWVDMVSLARSSAAQVGRYHELRYEDLVLEPEAELRKLCDFLELEYSSRMLDYRISAERHLGHLGDRPLANGRGNVPHALRARLHENIVQPLRADRVRGWRRQMSPQDCAKVEAIAGSLMRELGYGGEPG
ncbi:MAG TPA: sulfotransferase [Casimicrobiaceae bacterium]|nr:sulfotransferase [Casimicrobiaceae bacterium]